LAAFYFIHLPEKKGVPWLVFLETYDMAEYDQFHHPKALMAYERAVDLVAFFRRFSAKHSEPSTAQRPKRARLGDWVQTP
jgi:hypothetical protein